MEMVRPVDRRLEKVWRCAQAVRGGLLGADEFHCIDYARREVMVWRYLI